MVRSIDRKRMRELVSNGAQLVEVLPEDEFKWLHIPGALNIPIKELGRRAPTELDRNRPVVVYCHDYL